MSNDTIARYVKAAAIRQIDVNLQRKGDKSTGCTVFLDEETHRVLIVVCARSKRPLRRSCSPFSRQPFLVVTERVPTPPQRRCTARRRLRTTFPGSKVPIKPSTML